MPKPSQTQDLSVLASAKNGLVYLTANDWALIADKATRRQFKTGDSLVQQGRRTHGVFLLLSGTATVQIAGQTRSTEIGPGEVCGEISFLDELPATADVVASNATETYYLDRPTLQSLFELFPHLGSRFYRSLASILSRRLREVIGRQPAMAQSSKKTPA
jgi:CRP-like cAMP-binding protein